MIPGISLQICPGQRGRKLCPAKTTGTDLVVFNFTEFSRYLTP